MSLSHEEHVQKQFGRMWCYDCDASQMAFLAIGDSYDAKSLSMDDLDTSWMELLQEYEAKESQSGSLVIGSIGFPNTICNKP